MFYIYIIGLLCVTQIYNPLLVRRKPFKLWILIIFMTCEYCNNNGSYKCGACSDYICLTHSNVTILIKKSDKMQSDPILCCKCRGIEC